MSRIVTLLTQNSTHRLDIPSPTNEEIERLESQLAWALPLSYREFVALDGLNDLRFNHQIFSPSEIQENCTYVGESYVPFAGNGCGDLFCWPRQGGEPPVLLWDHEINHYQPEAGSFVEWLEKNRF